MNSLTLQDIEPVEHSQNKLVAAVELYLFLLAIILILMISIMEDNEYSYISKYIFIYTFFSVNLKINNEV